MYRISFLFLHGLLTIIMEYKCCIINYSIKPDDKKRPFSTLSVKLFAFDLALNVDSVVFNKGDNLQKVYFIWLY